jgi:hypothetical protein
MKKCDFKKLVMTGLIGGLIAVQHGEAQAENATKDESKDTAKGKAYDPNDSNLNYHLMSEDELLLELSPEGIAMYKTLDPEGKTLVRQVASMRCAGTNLCAGLNACKSDKNECAGKSDCRGKGICGLSDKNLAVKLVRDKMAKKRAEALNAVKNP